MSKTSKLNLTWVNDLLKEEYKKWNKGDVILLQAQTGTGKTYFIKNTLIPSMNLDETMLILCNRRYLKQQIKMDLLSKAYEEDKIKICEKFKKDSIEELTYDDLEKITKIGNVTIISYHALQYSLIDEKYGKNQGVDKMLDTYKYIVCDEAHYLLSDATFSNKCRFAFYKLIEHNMNTCKIFISATLDNLRKVIKGSKEKENDDKYKLYEYTTGIDYSYINDYYYKYNVDNIYKLINNDKTDNKWLVFISNVNDGDLLLEKLGVAKASFIKAGDKSDDVKQIISESKFDKKVLITTKALDNGVNFQDNKLTNIIINTYDKITFIQMLGRIRIDIENPKVVNMYIPIRSKKCFTTLNEKVYEPKNKFIKLYNESSANEFNKKYDIDFYKLPSELFYKDGCNWKINIIGYAALLRQKMFADKMIYLFKENKYAFIEEQLSWLGLEFNEDNIIGRINDMDDMTELYNYLKSIVGKKLFKEEKTELINKINYRIGGKQKKTIKHMNVALETEELPFEILDKRTNKERYWLVEFKSDTFVI